MSYSTITRAATDSALTFRIQAAVVQEAWNNSTNSTTSFAKDVQISPGNAMRLYWPVCISSDIEAAYASAIASDNPNPGGDESVITDEMILSAVQVKWPQDPPAE